MDLITRYSSCFCCFFFNGIIKSPTLQLHFFYFLLFIIFYNPYLWTTTYNMDIYVQ